MAALEKIIKSMTAREKAVSQLQQELSETRSQATDTLYKNVQQYLVLFAFDISERDPSLGQHSSLSAQFASQVLGESSSGIIGHQVPVQQFNKQLNHVETGIAAVEVELQRLAPQIASALSFNKRVTEAKRTNKLGVVTNAAQ